LAPKLKHVTGGCELVEVMKDVIYTQLMQFKHSLQLDFGFHPVLWFFYDLMQLPFTSLLVLRISTRIAGLTQLINIRGIIDITYEKIIKTTAIMMIIGIATIKKIID